MVGMSFPALWNTTPTPVPQTPTPDVVALASTPVTRNQGWTPITQAFDGVTMVLVPAGSFEMGTTLAQAQDTFAACQIETDDACNAGWFEAELFPPEGNTQTFAPFWIDQTEVTQADFERIGGIKADANRFEGDQRPVEQITWFEARDFCEARGVAGAGKKCGGALCLGRRICAGADSDGVIVL